MLPWGAAQAVASSGTADFCTGWVTAERRRRTNALQLYAAVAAHNAPLPLRQRSAARTAENIRAMAATMRPRQTSCSRQSHTGAKLCRLPAVAAVAAMACNANTQRTNVHISKHVCKTTCECTMYKHARWRMAVLSSHTRAAAASRICESGGGGSGGPHCS